MDVYARKVLKSKKQYILENLILNDEILDKLEEKDTLNEDMIQRIQAERTDHQKINRLLYILKKRGPTAFKEFVDAIRKDFNFVSEVLETEYAHELENVNNQDSSCLETPKHDLPRYICEDNTSSEETELKNQNKVHISSVGTQTSDIPVDRNTNSDFMQRMMQESFRCWYTKIKSHMTNRNLRELSFRSPEPVTYDMVDQLIDELIETVEGCYRTLRVRDNLVTHVIELKESRKKMKKELDEKDQLKNKYADNIIKLENRYRTINEKFQEEERKNQKLQADFENLKEKVEDELKEKDAKIDALNHKLNVTMFEKVPKVKIEKKNFKQNSNGHESDTELTDIDVQKPSNKHKRAKSIEDYQKLKHISYFKTAVNRHDHSSKVSRHVREVKHNNGRESKELTAVEEPDEVNLTRSHSFIESCHRRSLCSCEKLHLKKSLSSDKENNGDHHDDYFHVIKLDENLTENNQTLMVENVAEPIQTLLVGNSSYTSYNTSNTVIGETNPTQNKKARGRKNSHIVRPRKKNLDKPRIWYGIHENNQEALKKAAKHAPNEPRNLSSLVVVNNTKSPLQESPRGAKVMKHT